MTFSIIASEPGVTGGAAASHSVAVGSRVLWARRGVGVVATQAMTDPSYGATILDLLDAGADPAESLRTALGRDGAPQLRQVAVVDVGGRIAGHTGAGCVDIAESARFDLGIAQGNMLAQAGTCEAMVGRFTSFDAGAGAEDLARRLVHALDAGEEAGGDERGTRSASVLVTDEGGLVVDLRVDDHRTPVRELRRLLDESALQRQIVTAHELALRAGTDAARALAARLLAAAPASVERDSNRLLWAGLMHLLDGQFPAGMGLLRRSVSLRPASRRHLERVLRQTPLPISTVARIREEVG